jgi:hypothetical protein
MVGWPGWYLDWSVLPVCHMSECHDCAEDGVHVCGCHSSRLVLRLSLETGRTECVLVLGVCVPVGDLFLESLRSVPLLLALESDLVCLCLFLAERSSALGLLRDLDLPIL